MSLEIRSEEQLKDCRALLARRKKEQHEDYDCG